MSENHWDEIYRSKSDQETSWHQPAPDVSLALLDAAGLTAGNSVIDVGGGRSTLVDELLARGHADVAVLDLSAEALQQSRDRLGAAGEQVAWVTADVTTWEPPRTYDVWHDRAVFHFLTEPGDRAAYADAMRRAVRPGGRLIIGTFAADGPTHCSGLPTARYDASGLLAALGPGLELVDEEREEHHTPWDTIQPFTWIVARTMS